MKEDLTTLLRILLFLERGLNLKGIKIDRIDENFNFFLRFSHVDKTVVEFFDFFKVLLTKLNLQTKVLEIKFYPSSLKLSGLIPFSPRFFEDSVGTLSNVMIDDNVRFTTLIPRPQEKRLLGT